MINDLKICNTMRQKVFIKIRKILIIILLLVLYGVLATNAESRIQSDSKRIIIRLSNLEKNIEILNNLNELAIKHANGKIFLNREQLDNIISLYDSLIYYMKKEIETESMIKDEEYQKILDDVLTKSKQLLRQIEYRNNGKHHLFHKKIDDKNPG